jgi:DHA1 family tetracycline resistance protein-like MFS transporter
MNKTLILLSAIVATDMIGFGIIIPLLPFYSEALGATPFELALVIACFPATQLLSYPVAGRLSDWFGRKRLITLSLFVSATSYVILGFADTLSMLLISRIMAGLGGTTYSVAQAYVADSTHESLRTPAMSRLGAGYGIGLILGPAIGGYASLYGFGFAGFTAAAISLSSLTLALIMLPEIRHAPALDRAAKPPISVSAWARAYSKYPLSLLVVAYFLTSVAFDGTMSMLALFLERRISLNVHDAGILWAWSGAVIVLVRLGLAGLLADRFGEKSAVMLGLGFLLCGVASVLFTTSFAFTLCAATLLATGYSVVFPTMMSLASKLSAASSQGSVLGGFMLFGGLGRTVGPILAGWAFQNSSIDTPMIAAAIVFLAAAVLAIALPSLGPFSK